jgi:dTMP kinase
LTIEERQGGLFVTLEGIEGSGKTTQLLALQAFLTDKGLPVRVTREPGGTPIGEAIRKILLSPEHSEMVGLSELFLYEACRAQHVHQILLPSLERGEILLCDRFSDATLAYQAYARGLDIDLVRQVNEMATAGLSPDLTILLDCDVESGLDRSWKRLRREGKITHESRFESETLEFHRRVRMGYLEIARQNPERICVVAGSRPSEEVQLEVRRLLLKRLERKTKPLGKANGI